METAISAINLIDASLKLLDRLKVFYREHDRIPDAIRSTRRDLESIKEALAAAGPQNSEQQQQGTLTWMEDLRRIKLRIEDVIELYDVKFEGIGARVGEKILAKSKRVIGPGRKIRGYLKEIEMLSSGAKERVSTYHLLPSRAPPPAQQTCTRRRNDRRQAENYCSRDLFYHDNEPEPVGLDTPREGLLQVLSTSDATLLRVVAITGGPESEDIAFARRAYEHVLQSKEEFTCKAWVTASRSGDRRRLLKDMIAALGQQRQRGGSFDQLAQILWDFLKNKR